MTTEDLKKKLLKDKTKYPKPDAGTLRKFRDGGGTDDDDKPGDNPSPTGKFRIKKL
jgi:hypothetical protein